MVAPDCYNETARNEAVEPFLKLEHWKDKELFKPIVTHLRKQFGVGGVSFSLIHKKKVLVKYETKLDIRELPRMALLDSHSILSSGSFLLLDASNDWRTAKNPFVAGSPYIRFYCGVNLVSSKEEAIGVLAIFDNFVKPSFSELKVHELTRIAADVMQMLETPYDEVLKKNQETKKEVKSNGLDTELAELSLKLGRATSRGSHMTLFEKDGSGNPYSQNHNFQISKMGHDNETITKNCLRESEKHNVYRIIYKVGSLRTAAGMMCKSIANSYGVDFVYILEIRIAELYTISSEYFPKSVHKIYAEKFKHANKLVKANRKAEVVENLLTRVLGTFGSDYQMVNFEDAFLRKAFVSDFGLHYENPQNNAVYNSGILIPFHRYNSKLVRRSSTGLEGTTEVYLRSGGYMVGVFNLSARAHFDSTLVSKIFDHTSILRKIYIS